MEMNKNMPNNGKKSEDYLSESAKRFLENPTRARIFCLTYFRHHEARLSFNGVDYVLNSKTNLMKIPDEAIVWIAKTQAGFENWMEENNLTPIEEGDL